MSDPTATTTHHDAVREQVRSGYAKIAAASSAEDQSGSASSCCGGGCCAGPAATMSPQNIAHAIGYSDDDLAAIPDGANLGLSCGNPTAIASLVTGEIVLDLGSGGGFDCFIAGRKVGHAGRVIGVDMTAEMIAKARRNLLAFREQTALDNVEFRLGEIEHLPVADRSVDVVISNCVINLSPDKPQVWREIARVLRPGGRVAVSDLALLRRLPESVLRDIEALVGCIAGAVLIDETRQHMQDAGLTGIRLTPKPIYIRAMNDFQDPLYRRIAQQLPPGMTPNEFITSLDISATRP